MSLTNVKWLDVGTNQSTNQVGGKTLPAGNTASNYTPNEVDTEGTDKISAHLNGINDTLGNVPQGAADDVSPAGVALVNNQAIFLNISDLLFSSVNTISFSAIISTKIDATADVGEVFNIEGVYNGREWC